MDIIEIKRINFSDAQFLHKLSSLAYIENFAHHWNEGGLEWYLDKVYSVEALEHDLLNINVQFYICYFQGDPAGFIKLKLEAPIGNNNSALEIEKVYVRPKFHGKGIGKKMFTKAFDLAYKLDKSYVWLAVIDKNTPALEFYQKLGFDYFEKTSMDLPYFKDELRGMWKMIFDMKKYRTK